MQVACVGHDMCVHHSLPYAFQGGCSDTPSSVTLNNSLLVKLL
jgi:hypothetical protein